MNKYREDLMEQERADLDNRKKTQKLHGESPDDIPNLERSSESGWKDYGKSWDKAAETAQKAADKAEYDATGWSTVGKGKRR